MGGYMELGKLFGSLEFSPLLAMTLSNSQTSFPVFERSYGVMLYGQGSGIALSMWGTSGNKTDLKSKKGLLVWRAQRKYYVNFFKKKYSIACLLKHHFPFRTTLANFQTALTYREKPR